MCCPLNFLLLFSALTTTAQSQTSTTTQTLPDDLFSTPAGGPGSEGRSLNWTIEKFGCKIADTGPHTYYQARDKCSGISLALPSPKTPVQNAVVWAFAKSHASSPGEIWIGLKDSYEEHIWRWDGWDGGPDNSPVGEVNWLPGQPDNGGYGRPSEDHGQMLIAGTVGEGSVASGAGMWRDETPASTWRESDQSTTPGLDALVVCCDNAKLGNSTKSLEPYRQVIEEKIQAVVPEYTSNFVNGRNVVFCKAAKEMCPAVVDNWGEEVCPGIGATGTAGSTG